MVKIAPVITIDKDKCIACGACKTACPVQLFSIVDDKATLTGDPDKCVLCQACENTCPVGAIKVSEKTKGEQDGRTPSDKRGTTHH